MASYEFVCAPCQSIGLILEEDQKPGFVVVQRNIADRDAETLCPNCSSSMVRRVAPNFTTRWLSNKSSKRYPIMEGPTDNVYLRGEERKKKEARAKATRHFGTGSGLITAEQSRELKADERRVPAAAEVPSAGVSVRKES